MSHIPGEQTAAQPAPEPTAGAALVSAGLQLVNELVRQLQARTVEETESAAARLERRIARLKERNRVLEECVAFLTSAVGMCAACFGRLAECPVCRGHGQPGKLAVDPTAFSEIVAPLFEQQPERMRELMKRCAASDPTTFADILVGFGEWQSNDAAHGSGDTVQQHR